MRGVKELGVRVEDITTVEESEERVVLKRLERVQ